MFKNRWLTAQCTLNRLLSTGLVAAAAVVSATPALGGDEDAEGSVCFLWNNGFFDRREGQVSQVLTAQGTSPQDYRVADDLYLEPGYMHRLDRINATFFSVAPLEDAKLEFRADCNGEPGEVLRELTNPLIQVTGTYSGTTEYRVSFDAMDIWVPGGVYWVTVVGIGLPTAGEFYWGTTGPTIKGTPAKVRSVVGGIPAWRSIEELCCGCTDFNFRVRGASCKILHDNGTYNIALPAPLGAPSLDNGAQTSMAVRTADNFAVPACDDAEVCFIEAYIYSNCPDGRVTIYRDDCNKPGEVLRTLTPTRIIDTGQDVTIGGKVLNVLCLQFCNIPSFTLPAGANYWISAYGLGTGTQNAASYFARNYRCDKNPDCQVTFSAGKIKGPAVSRTSWVPVRQIIANDFDFAFKIATKDDLRESTEGDPNGTVACNIDTDGNGARSLEDLLLFFDMWTVGCP